MSSNIVARFPPSPTGLLHIGNARVAVLNYLFAKNQGGKYYLRFDDTDIERSKEEHRINIEKDLEWLGIQYDEVFRQSERTEQYDAIFQLLLDSGKVYPCYETKEELDIKRKIASSQGLPPIYDRASLRFTEQQKLNKKVYYRFKIEEEEIAWIDLVQGEIKYHGKDLSDPIIKRENGSYMYTFCSVVDDYLMGITNIIRGADHITNTAYQIQIFNAISALKNDGNFLSNLKFAHMSLFQASKGKISKRVGGNSIQDMRNSGIESITIKNFLASIGLSSFEMEVKTNQELIQNFDLQKFCKSSILFDEGLLHQLNSKYISRYRYEDIEDRVESWVSSEIFDVLKNNITSLDSLKEWEGAFKSDEKYLHILSEEDSKFATLAGESYNENWDSWIGELKNKFPDRKGKKLFMPLRIAITGKENGPDMKSTIKLIGEGRVINRLKAN